MNSGILYVVATPIGNLADISRRAINVLSDVDLILAEDTRHCRILLQEYGITTRVRSFHEHNEASVTQEIIDCLISGNSIALISDAGTPLVNDPGYLLVEAAHTNQIRVVPIPGPSAVISALSVSGLSIDRFAYEGFLPNRHAARINFLEELASEKRTMVFYESTHRIIECLEDMISVFGSDREATLAKELTKQHENILHADLAQIRQWLMDDVIRQKGEFVLLVSGKNESETDEKELIRVLQILLKHMSLKDAVNVAAEILKQHRNHLYNLAVKLKDQ